MSKHTLFFLLAFLTLFMGETLLAQTGNGYWNIKTNLQPRRMPLADNLNAIERIDLDKDGDPDIMKYIINKGVPVMWIDDNDNMKPTDIEGDMIGDCLCIDRNNDGKFAGPEDISIDWIDFENDGKPNMQWVVENGDDKIRFRYDWLKSNVMAFIDDDQEGVFNYFDWNLLTMRHWEMGGYSNFFTDYQGNTTFTKICAASYRLNDIRYSWENPFIFWDFDRDGRSEMAMRMLDIPFIKKSNDDPVFVNEDKEVDFMFAKKITYVAVTYDLDNDNGQGNELDFDISLLFEGDGFSYTDQVNEFESMKGLPAANRFLFDSSWRKVDELIFPNRKTALDLTYNRGKWNQCRLVFDEDDDCNRWERVEFYDPKKLFATGKNGGGLDHNPQADVVGDRGEFDLDFSGKGNLYIGGFDGKIHLHGAEWGAWRIDQTAFSYQGFGGLYELWSPDRLQKSPNKFATVKHSDTDNNGFFDKFQYDLDGDTIFEHEVSLRDLQIDDRQQVIQTSGLSYADFQNLFASITTKNWANAQKAIEVAHRFGLSTGWYAFWKNPRTLHEKYDYAYWLNFYIYNDLVSLANRKGDKTLAKLIDKAYFSGNWDLLKL